jgi:hypothetical protein
MSAKPKGIPIPRPGPKARELGFEALGGAVVVTDSVVHCVVDADTDVDVLTLDEVNAAIWSGRKTIVPTGIDNRLAEVLQAVVSDPQRYEILPLSCSVLAQGKRACANPTSRTNHSRCNSPFSRGGRLNIPFQMFWQGEPQFGSVQPFFASKLFPKPLKQRELDRQ